MALKLLEGKEAEKEEVGMGGREGKERQRGAGRKRGGGVGGSGRGVGGGKVEEGGGRATPQSGKGLDFPPPPSKTFLSFKDPVLLEMASTKTQPRNEPLVVKT